jgi:hypothetical protein
MTRKTSAKATVPTFASVEEEAAYWDAHSLADHWASATPVRLRVAKNLSEGVTIRFDPETLAEIRRFAAERGIGPSTLLRMWVRERLILESKGRD